MLKLIEKEGLYQDLKANLISKIISLNSEFPKGEEHAKLWNYARKWLHTICEKFETSLEALAPIIEALQVIVSRYDSEDFSKKLTTEFL